MFDCRFVILEVISKQSTEMGFVQDDHVVQQFPATASHPALRHAVLPGTAMSRSDQLAAEVFQRRRDLSAELAVAVQDQILGCTILWEGLSQLLHDPGTGGMLSVTLKCRILRRPCSITKKPYSTRKVAVGTVKKSMAAIASRWFLRKVNSVSKGERALDRVNSFAVLQLGA